MNHLTGVGAAALAVHLRYLLDPGPPEAANLRFGPPKPTAIPDVLVPPKNSFPIEIINFGGPLFNDDVYNGVNR